MQSWLLSMMKFCWICLFLFAVTVTFGQQSAAKKYEGFVNLVADPMFGIYPTLQIGRNISAYNVFLYGTYYYQGREVVKFPSPYNHWIESGAGILRKIPEKNCLLAVSIGIMDGKYYSGIKQYGFGDGIDPGFNFLFDNTRHFFNVGGYYVFSISSHGPIPYDLIWYWSNYSYAVKRNFYVGLYYEHFCQVSNGKVVPVYLNKYQWIGPSLEYRYKKATFKISSGYDIVNHFYYKMTIAYNL